MPASYRKEKGSSSRSVLDVPREGAVEGLAVARVVLRAGAEAVGGRERVAAEGRGVPTVRIVVAQAGTVGEPVRLPLGRGAVSVVDVEQIAGAVDRAPVGAAVAVRAGQSEDVAVTAVAVGGSGVACGGTVVAVSGVDVASGRSAGVGVGASTNGATMGTEGVTVLVAVGVTVTVGVIVTVGVAVVVGVTVMVGVLVTVGVPVTVGVLVMVGVLVIRGVGVGGSITVMYPGMTAMSRPPSPPTASWTV